jgi:hypothetical protein
MRWLLLCCIPINIGLFILNGIEGNDWWCMFNTGAVAFCWWGWRHA